MSSHEKSVKIFSKFASAQKQLREVYKSHGVNATHILDLDTRSKLLSSSPSGRCTSGAH
jgi:hypothetical protein